ncbi:hypothetical protein GCM10027447_25230 [Glycomyces halotolerans]
MPLPSAARVNRLAPMPFWVGLAVAALLLAAAFDYGRFGPEDRVSTVEELEQSGLGGADESPPEWVEADVAIAESGFGTVTDETGEELGTVGAILRNTGDKPANVTLEVLSELSSNNVIVHADYQLGLLPPGEDVYLGGNFPLSGSRPPPELRLRMTEASSYASVPEFFRDLEPVPAVELIGTVPLFSPPGTRVEFETEAFAGETAWTAALLFRDADGEIVGGMPATLRPLAGDGVWTQPLLEGRSVHHTDVPERLIPEGADLDRIEVGPSLNF